MFDQHALLNSELCFLRIEKSLVFFSALYYEKWFPTSALILMAVEIWLEKSEGIVGVMGFDMTVSE